jgi:P-type Cu+ transporter
MEESMTTTDPVCGMPIDQSNAAGTLTHAGAAYYFCSGACQARFEADPAKYAPSA